MLHVLPLRAVKPGPTSVVVVPGILQGTYPSLAQTLPSNAMEGGGTVLYDALDVTSTSQPRGRRGVILTTRRAPYFELGMALGSSMFGEKHTMLTLLQGVCVSIHPSSRLY